METAASALLARARSLRGRALVGASLASLVFGAIACNSILGNELGHLDDASAPGDSATADGDAIDADGIADAAADAGPWSPASFGADLALWLDGDVGVSTAFCAAPSGRCATIWADQSGHHNDAHALSSPGQPALVQLPAAHNGRHALHFDGTNSDLSIADSTSMEILKGFTILAVAAQSPGSPHTGAFFTKTAAPIPFAGAALWINYENVGSDGAAGHVAAQVDYYQYVAATQMRFDDGVLRVYSATFDGSMLSVRVNDAAPVSRKVDVSHESLAAPGIPASIGGGVFSGQVILGDIAEVIFATRAIDAAEWTRAYAHLKTKYALP